MKKILACVLALIGILSIFSACSKKKSENVPQKLDNISSGYTGDVKVEQKVKTQSLDIVQGRYVFTINNTRYRFKDFEKTPKRTTRFGEYKMDIYVENSTLQKCVLNQSNKYGRTVFSVTFMPDGKASDYYKYTCDDFGNVTSSIHYDKDGKLESFSTSEYDENTNLLTAEYFYNANYVLQKVVKYSYNEDGKLISTAYYDGKGELKKTEKP